MLLLGLAGSLAEAAEAVQAGHRLVVLEVESSTQCDTGLDEEAELHWKDDKVAALQPCSGLKHLLQRTARDCPDVKFLTLEASHALQPGAQTHQQALARHFVRRQTQRRARQPATSLGWTCCPPCSSTKTAPSSGSTAATWTCNRTWARVRCCWQASGVKSRSVCRR